MGAPTTTAAPTTSAAPNTTSVPTEPPAPIYNPNSALLFCSSLPADFITCDLPDLSSLSVVPPDSIGCLTWGLDDNGNFTVGTANCTVLEGIECDGPRAFSVEMPCLRYNGFRYANILLFSIFLGFLGIDRLCMCQILCGVFKCLSIGGLGVWWLVDIILLASGNLWPADGYSWEPYW